MAAYPSRIPRPGGGLAIRAHSHLDYDQRFFRDVCDVAFVDGLGSSSCGRTIDVYTRTMQCAGPRSFHERIRVLHPEYDLRDPFPDDSIGARRRALHRVRARFHGDIQRSATCNSLVVGLSFRILDRFDFGVRFPRNLVVSLTYYYSVLD